MAQYSFPIQDQVSHSAIEYCPIPEPSEPDTVSFSKFKTSWLAKMELLWLKGGLGWGWDYIETYFEGRIKMTKRQSWYGKYFKTVREVEAMGKAAATDKEGEINRLATTFEIDEINDVHLRIDYNLIWGRIAKLMKAYGSSGWTAEKVRFAWDNGVSERYPDIVLHPVTWSKELAQLVSEGRTQLLRKE